MLRSLVISSDSTLQILSLRFLQEEQQKKPGFENSLVKDKKEFLNSSGHKSSADERAKPTDKPTAS